MNSTDPTILQAIASLLRSAWAILIGVLAVGIGWGTHQREIKQQRQDITALKDELIRVALESERNQAALEARMETRRSEDIARIERRFDRMEEKQDRTLEALAGKRP
ncbi:MAG: hypothetical protein KGL63_14860 [Betaproteobacteria bacterium]|nr:hypothetical protein [Betaproteobacteria bacterium]